MSAEAGGEGEGQGLAYYVSDDMLRRFAASTPLQRLRWLEDMRRFTWNAATEETRRRWRAERDRARGLASSS